MTEVKVPKIITRKFMVLKMEPTHTRITELQLLLRNFTDNPNFDIFSKGRQLDNICNLIENVIQNRNKFKANDTINFEKLEKKPLESILREKLSAKLYKKIEMNLAKLEEDKAIDIEAEEGFDSEDDISEVLSETESVGSEGGYSLYKEDSDEDEGEFSD